jgi:hypothetical protein
MVVPPCRMDRGCLPERVRWRSDFRACAVEESFELKLDYMNNGNIGKKKMDPPAGAPLADGRQWQGYGGSCS